MSAQQRRRLAYWRWRKMIARCTNPADKDYRYYGARGITVCDAWRDFETFYRDTGDPPSGMTLDRIDCDKGYGPGNVRWATRLEQTRNRRKATHCTYGHEYTDANTYVYAKTGERHCRACQRRNRQRAA